MKCFILSHVLSIYHGCLNSESSFINNPLAKIGRRIKLRLFTSRTETLISDSEGNTIATILYSETENVVF